MFYKFTEQGEKKKRILVMVPITLDYDQYLIAIKMARTHEVSLIKRR